MNNVYIKLMEESGELVQACAKVLKYKDEEWLGRLEEECGDVMAFIHLMAENGIVNQDAILKKKWETIAKYGECFYNEDGYNTVKNRTHFEDQFTGEEYVG